RRAAGVQRHRLCRPAVTRQRFQLWVGGYRCADDGTPAGCEVGERGDALHNGRGGDRGGRRGGGCGGGGVVHQGGNHGPAAVHAVGEDGVGEREGRGRGGAVLDLVAEGEVVHRAAQRLTRKRKVFRVAAGGDVAGERGVGEGDGPVEVEDRP